MEQLQINPRDGWDFAFKDFIIAAWNPPGVTDAEIFWWEYLHSPANPLLS